MLSPKENCLECGRIITIVEDSGSGMTRET